MAITPSKEKSLVLAEKLNVSYTITLNVGGVTEKNLDADELDTILYALRLTAKPADEVREATIEECAKIAENINLGISIFWTSTIAKHIRALSSMKKPKR